MFVTVVAVMCKLMVAHATLAPDRYCTEEEQTIEEIVTDSSMDDNITFQTCMIHAQMGLADWQAKHPIYSKPGWRFGRFKCAPGHYEIKGRA